MWRFFLQIEGKTLHQQKGHNLLYCCALETNPPYLGSMPILETAATSGQNHQLTVCRHYEQEIVQREANSLIPSTPICLTRVQETHDTPYHMGSGGREMKSQWKDPEVIWETYLCFRE